ncbi:response regulator [Peribacillus sp. SCS-26]|uniref:response regulator n=1 Tax=Paraperibacillus marinus TaxID=3115295 RepID=UPI003905D827
MIKVLIVEDDPMVAEFNKRYLQEIEGFILAGTVHKADDALKFLAETKVDLILLDVYMPGVSGLSLLRTIRKKGIAADVILITAAAAAERIQEALRFGAVDYLIKPFEFERFNQALQLYKEKHAFFAGTETIRQQDLDEFLSRDSRSGAEVQQVLPKGLTRSTLQAIVTVIEESGGEPFSTDDIADKTFISRVSVRKYLKFLADLDVLEESLTYGIGRPVYLYTFKKEKLETAKMYL